MATEGRHRYHPFDASPYAATKRDSNREPVLADYPLDDRDRRDVPDRRKLTRNGRPRVGSETGVPVGDPDSGKTAYVPS